MTRIAIIGAGHLGIQLAHHITTTNQGQVVGYFDDFANGRVNGLPVFGKIKEIKLNSSEFDELIIAIGYNHLKFKNKLYEDLSNIFDFFTFIHPSAIVDPSAEIGSGVAVYPGCVIDMNVEIGNNTLLNNGVIVSHDSQVGPSTFLAPGVCISGNCSIGHRCFIGTSTILKDGVRIADDVQTGAGSLVVSHLTDSGLYIGSPAKKKLA